MMWHGVPLLVSDDMAQLLRYFDNCPEQLPPLVLLVYESAKMLKSYFEVPLGLEEIIQLLHVTEGKGT